MPEYFDQLFDDLYQSVKPGNYDAMYSPEWRDENISKAFGLPPHERAEADLIFYKSEIRDGVKFSQEEHAKYRQLFMQLKQTKEAA